MRKALLSLAAIAAIPVASASAADMALKAPPAPAPAGYSWTGFYLGGEIGGGWATETTTVVTATGAAFPPGTVLSPINLDGFMGGGYAGFNYQFNQIVIGIDGDYQGADVSGTGTDTSTVDGDIAHHSDKMNWLATVTGRLGLAENNWLFYGKGGAAWAGFSASTVTNTPAGGLAASATSSDNRNGWTAGGGIEWGFAPHWSAKLEYDYVQFDTSTYSISEVSGAGVVASPAPTRSTTSSLNEVKGGVAFRF